ncbi:flagellar basal body rod protein FlgC [Buchnera aphidicola]|uniref:flagellar basal body rod protein FlgC n=1 Tax=Buchnera aphidicola TaxID=9 RepID=UPI003463C689
MSLLNILNISGSAMIAQAEKMRIHAKNIANSESITNRNGKFYPYIAKQVILKQNTNFEKNIGGVHIDQIINDPNPCKLIYNPSNKMADKKGYVHMSNVNIITEMVNTVSAARNYQANVEVINTVKLMIIKTLNIGK